MVAHASLTALAEDLAARRPVVAFAAASHALLAELTSASPAVLDGSIIVDAFLVGVARPDIAAILAFVVAALVVATVSHALLIVLSGTSPAVFYGPVVIDAFLVGVARPDIAVILAVVVAAPTTAAVIAQALLVVLSGTSPAVLFRSVVFDAFLVGVA